jgi:triosephosphate isomerase
MTHLTTKGHSERRTLFHETSEMVAQKTRAALDAGLNVILCIGETLEQRESGNTTRVCEEQLKAAVNVLKESDWRYDNLLADLRLLNEIIELAKLSLRTNQYGQSERAK